MLLFRVTQPARLHVIYGAHSCSLGPPVALKQQLFTEVKPDVYIVSALGDRIQHPNPPSNLDCGSFLGYTTESYYESGSR